MSQEFTISSYVVGINTVFKQITDRLAYSETERNRLLEVVAKKDERVVELSQLVDKLNARIHVFERKIPEKDAKITELVKKIEELEASIDDAGDNDAVLATDIRTPEWNEWTPDVIKAFRKFTGMSDAMFARASGIHAATIWTWVAGMYQPSKRKGDELSAFARRMGFKTSMTAHRSEPAKPLEPAAPEPAVPEPAKPLEPAVPESAKPDPPVQVWSGRRLTEFRAQHQLNRNEMGTMLSYSSNAVKKWETGQRSIPREVWTKLDAIEKLVREKERNGEPIFAVSIKMQLREAV